MALAFVLLCVLLSAALGDVYPFSRMPMFSDAPRVRSTFSVRAPDGRVLPSWQFGLHSLYVANEHARLGYRYSLGLPGAAPQLSADEVIALVRPHLATSSEPLEYVEVIEEIVGPIGRSVGVVEQRRTRVSR